MIAGTANYPDWHLLYAANVVGNLLDPNNTGEVWSKPVRKVMSIENGWLMGGSLEEEEEKASCNEASLLGWHRGCFGLKSYIRYYSEIKDSHQLERYIISNRYEWLKDGFNNYGDLTFRADGTILHTLAP